MAAALGERAGSACAGRGDALRAAGGAERGLGDLVWCGGELTVGGVRGEMLGDDGVCEIHDDHARGPHSEPKPGPHGRALRAYTELHSDWGLVMSTIDLLAGVLTVAFGAVFVGCTLLSSGGLSLERRAAMLERRDPGSAEALRRAQALHDLGYVGLLGDEVFPVVCTPNRRSALDMARVRASDSDLRVEPPEEALPPMPPTVVALAGQSHVAAAPTTPRAARRARATSRRRAGIR